MAEPTQREREIAEAIDLALVDIELSGGDMNEHSAEVRSMLAQKLAEYREELSGHRAPADGYANTFVDIEEALRALAGRPEEHDDGR